MQADSGRTGPRAGPGRVASAAQAGTERALAASLRVMVIPVAALVLSGLGAFAYGIAVFIHGIDTIGRHPFPAGGTAAQGVPQRRGSHILRRYALPGKPGDACPWM